MSKSLSLILTAAIAVAMTAGMITSCGGNANCNNGCNPDEPQLIMDDNIAIANTKYGKVKDYILRGTYTFKGIPYGITTAGEGRFMPAQEPAPWEGIRPTVFYGPSAPQNMDNKWGNGTSYYSFSDHWYYFDTSEDCLYLNIWTPQLADGGKRPRNLSTKMTDALLSFMRTGVPSAKGMPKWPAYTEENGATMYLNDECKVMMAPDRQALHLM